jgi:hypothetical protein
MPDSKISNLTAVTMPLNSTDVLPIVQTGMTKKVTVAELQDTVDINGGTIDGTTIGGTTAAPGSFTTVSASGNLIVDTNTLFVDATNNRAGIGTTTPEAELHVKRLGDNHVATIESDNASADLFVKSSGGYIRLRATGSDIVLMTSNVARMRIASSNGYVGIGTTSPSYQLHVNTDSAGKPGAGGLWTVVSDERIKTDIIPADLDRCYEIVKSVPLKRYAFADGVYTDEQIQDKRNLGWIAQDVQKVFAKAVSVKPFTKYPDDETRKEVIEDCLDLNGSQMYAAMYGAVQKLMQKVEALETELLLLKGSNAQPTS